MVFILQIDLLTVLGHFVGDGGHEHLSGGELVAGLHWTLVVFEGVRPKRDFSS